MAVETRDETGECRGPEVYCAVEKQSRHKSVKDLEAREETAPPAGESAAKEKMADKLKRDKGKAVYKKRKETVEPVFGIIKAASNLRFEDSVNFC